MRYGRILGLAGVLLLAAGAVACSGPPSTGPRSPATPVALAAGGEPVASSAPTVTTGTTATTDSAPRWPVTLAFGGDVHFADHVAGLLKNPPASLVDLRPYFTGADVGMVNLETAITTRGVEAPKDFHFRTTPRALTALQSAGVDVVTMANNHAVDYGPVGLQDTLAAARRSPVPVVGIGSDAADAYAPAILDVRGVEVAVFGATQVPDWTLATWSASAARPGVASASSPARLAAAVRAARTRADVVVVYLHWGTDYTTCPNALQRRTAQVLAAAGADVVVGSHAHRLQGGGWLGRTYVGYGLGNFIWWRSRMPDAVTGVLTLTVDRPPGAARVAVTEASFAPLTISTDGVPRARGAAATSAARSAWQKLRGCSGLSAAPSTG